MRRRTLLSHCALLCGTATAGCTTTALEEAERPPPPLEGFGVSNVDLPVTQPLGVAAAEIERLAAATIDTPAAFAAALDAHQLTVRDLTVETHAGGETLSLHYTPSDAGDRGLMSHLGAVAGGYAALVDAGHESDPLEVTIHDATGDAFGTYESRRSWAESYLDGTTTAREYAEEIDVTVETR